MSKAALAGFTHGLARGLGPRGITVNSIQPGSHQYRCESRRRAEEVAALVAHLAGPEGGYINGAQIKIDGGFAA